MSVTSAKIRAVVSHDLCCGSGMCVYTAPNAYKLDNQRLAVFDPEGEWTPEDVREGADACPMSAISVIEAELEGDPP